MSVPKKPIVGTAKVGGMASYFITNQAYHKAPQMDLEFLKISCKKTEIPVDEKTLKTITFEFKWTFRAIFAALIFSLILFSAHLILEMSKRSNIRNKRSVDIYSKDGIFEWSNENVPSIYEIDIYDLIVKEQQMLNHIENDLKITCIQVTNVQEYVGIVFEEFLTNKTVISEMQIRRLNVLKKLIEKVHGLSIRFIVKITTDMLKSSDFNNFKELENYLILMVEFWSSNLDSDGIYLSGFSQIFNQENDAVAFQKFIFNLKRCAHNSALIPVFTLIGDFSHLNPDINQLYDMYRVNLNTTSLLDSFGKLEVYLKSGKKVIWALQDASSSEDFYFKQSFCFMYSLPGFPLIRHGEEFTHPYSQLNFSESYIKSSLNDENSTMSLIRLFNQKIKPKLNDFKPEIIATTTTESPWTTPNPRPEPFKNSFKSISDAYLEEKDIYKISVHFEKVLKITRQINTVQSRGFQFYRNVVFLFNFSPFNIPIEKLVQTPGNFRTSYKNRSPFHVLFDSSKILPEFLKVDDRDNLGLYNLKQGEHTVIEF